jgi:hypothetical protein
MLAPAAARLVLDAPGAHHAATPDTARGAAMSDNPYTKSRPSVYPGTQSAESAAIEAATEASNTAAEAHKLKAMRTLGVIERIGVGRMVAWIFVLVIVFVGCVIYLVFSQLRQAPEFVAAMKIIQTDPAAVEGLGEPIEAGYGMQATFHNGVSEYRFAVKGAKSEGDVFFVARESDGQVQFDQLHLSVGAQSIDLGERR